nr:immunoglobulin heavy chain junction region [Mus musculus]
CARAITTVVATGFDYW